MTTMKCTRDPDTNWITHVDPNEAPPDATHFHPETSAYYAAWIKEDKYGNWLCITCQKYHDKIKDDDPWLWHDYDLDCDVEEDQEVLNSIRPIKRTESNDDDNDWFI